MEGNCIEAIKKPITKKPNKKKTEREEAMRLFGLGGKKKDDK